MTHAMIKKIGPKINFKQACVDMSHGAGGKAMHQLIEQLFLREFTNEILSQQNDQAAITLPHGKLVLTTDAYTISPLFFPGGNIGSLAVHGTVNDIAVGGAVPWYLSAAFILEEGFPLSDLKRIVRAMAQAAREAGVQLVAGDTKVVEKGKGDGVFITTTGVGRIPNGIQISNQIRPGHKVLINGSIGDHGIAVMSKRENLQFHTSLQSDSASLHELTQCMLQVDPQIYAMRDPTRGGVAAVLNEWATQHGVGFMLDETQIPIKSEVVGACELLGIDPLYVANEGKLLAVCSPDSVDRLLKKMRSHPLGKDAAIIGEVIEDPECFVQMRTALGGVRLVDWLAGDQLPRIC